MYVVYGDLVFPVLRLIECNQTAKYDESGIDKLWDEYQFTFEMMYHKDLTIPYAIRALGEPVDSVAGPSRGKIVNDKEVHPVYSMRTLQHKLMMPRQKFIVAFENGKEVITWIESPVRKMKVDLDNGPTPLACEPQIFGDGETIILRWTIKTAINDCFPSRSGYFHLVLSNRCTSYLTYDETTQLATRVFVGTAVLRADIFKSSPPNIDWLKMKLIPPPPIDCNRVIDELVLLPDGHTIQYKVRDIELGTTYIDVATDKHGKKITPLRRRHVAHIRGVVKRTYSQKGTTDLIQAAQSSLLSAPFIWSQLENYIPDVGLTSLLGKRGGAAVGAVSKKAGPAGLALTALSLLPKVAGIGMAAINYANDVLPSFVETIIVEVFGTRKARRADLQYLAYSVAFGSMHTSSAKLYDIIAGKSKQSTFEDIVDITSEIAKGPLSIMKSFGFPFDFIIPAAHHVDLEYDIFAKRVKVEIQVEYSGLIDWVLDRTNMGRRSLVDPIPDEVIGGDWPGFFKFDALAHSGAVTMIGNVLKYIYKSIKGEDASLFGLPKLHDVDNLIATNSRGYEGIAHSYYYNLDPLNFVENHLKFSCDQEEGDILARDVPAYIEGMRITRPTPPRFNFNRNAVKFKKTEDLSSSSPAFKEPPYYVSEKVFATSPKFNEPPHSSNEKVSGTTPKFNDPPYNPPEQVPGNPPIFNEPPYKG